MLSSSFRYLFFGFMRMSKERKIEVRVNRKKMSVDDHSQLEKLNARIQSMKSALVKTPIVQEKEYAALVEQQEKEYCDIL